MQDPHNNNVGIVTPAPFTIEDAKRMFRTSYFASQDNDKNCLRDHQYYHGHQISESQRQKLTKRGQPVIYINRISRTIDGLLGLYDATQGDPQAYPRNPDEQDAADTVTKLLRYFKDRGDYKQKRRQWSENYFVEGTCAVMVGDGIKTNSKFVPIHHIQWEDFFADPLSVLHDFTDARFLGYSKWMDADAVHAAFPDSIDDLSKISATDTLGFDTKMDRETRALWINADRKRVRIIEMYATDSKGVWQRIMFCGGGMISIGPSPYEDDDGTPICPIVAASFKVERDDGNGNTIRSGAIRDLVPPQDEINARRSKLLHLTNNRTVQITQPDADPVAKSEAKKEASKADGVMPYGYEVRPAPDMAEGQMMILQQSQADIDRMTPTNAVLGAAKAAESGRLLEILQQAGMTEWSRPMGRLEAFENQVYRRVWWCARQYISDKLTVRVTQDFRAPQFLHVNVPKVGMTAQPVKGPDGQPVMNPQTGQPQIALQPGIVGYDNPLAQMDVDITLETVPQAPTLELEVWKELLGWSASLGVRVTDPEFKFALMAMPIPNKTATIEMLEGIMAKQQEEAAPQMQAQQQAQHEAQALQAQHMQTKAAKDQAQANKANADAALKQQELHHTEIAAQLAALALHAPTHGALVPVPQDQYAPTPEQLLQRLAEKQALNGMLRGNPPAPPQLG